MADKKRNDRRFALLITILVILLLLAVWLFVYGCTTNVLPVPHLPGRELSACGAMRCHG